MATLTGLEPATSAVTGRRAGCGGHIPTSNIVGIFPHALVWEYSHIGGKSCQAALTKITEDKG